MPGKFRRISNRHLYVTGDCSLARSGIEASGIADDFKIRAFDRSFLWGVQDPRVEVQDGFSHRDFEVHLVGFGISCDFQVPKFHMVLIEAACGSGNKTPAQMSVFVNIGKNESLGFVTDGQRNLRSSLRGCSR